MADSFVCSLYGKLKPNLVKTNNARYTVFRYKHAPKYMYEELPLAKIKRADAGLLHVPPA